MNAHDEPGRDALLMQWAAEMALADLVSRIDCLDDGSAVLIGGADGRKRRAYLAELRLDHHSAGFFLRERYRQHVALIAERMKQQLVRRYGVLEAEFIQARKDYEAVSGGDLSG